MSRSLEHDLNVRHLGRSDHGGDAVDDGALGHHSEDDGRVRGGVRRVSARHRRPILEEVPLQLLRFHPDLGEAVSVFNHLRSTSYG